MKTQPLRLLCALLLTSAILVPLTGCETESTSQAYITVEPRDATLSRGESVELRAAGWSDYRWLLADSALGYLSRTTGDTVIYTSRTSSRTTQTVTVTSDYAVLTGTNTVSETLVAEALITHVP